MPESAIDHDEVLRMSLGWMGDLEKALIQQDAGLFDELFLDDSYWRDLVAFTWDTQQFWVARRYARSGSSGRARCRRRISGCKTSDGTEADLGANRDAHRDVRRVRDCGGYWQPLRRAHPRQRCQVGHEGAPSLDHPHHRTALQPTRAPITRRGFEPAHPGESWLQWRTRVRDLENRDPEVVVVGGGASAG